METRQHTVSELNKQVEEHKQRTDTLVTDLRSEIDGRIASLEDKFSGLETVILKYFSNGSTQHRPQESGSSQSAGVLTSPEYSRPPDPPDPVRLEQISKRKVTYEAD